MKFRSCLCLALLVVTAAAFAEDDATPERINAHLMQMPAVSQTQIAFVFAGDIWIAPKAGGAALRLSSPRGTEQFPRFSPDGTLLGFSGNYEGNTDIYVIPVTGGEPRRITHHGASDRMLGWSTDGNTIYFQSEMAAFTNRVGQLYKVSAQGGLPEQLPVPYGEFGAISPDGKKLAYTTLSTEFRTWKRYRGGMAPDIWLFDLETHAAEKVAPNDANDSLPMWHGSTIYFLSDRDERSRENIWAYETTTQQLRQVTRFTEDDVHFPSIGPKEIVLENGGRLYLLDLATEKLSEIPITVMTDRVTLRPHQENVSALIQNGAISPTGKRALFEARGELFSVPAEHGVIRNLTETSGAAERSPAWSPDGKWVAYFSDRTGEYELTLRPADGKGEERTLTQLGPGFRYQPWWSPDSKKIVFIDQAMRIWLHDLDAKRTREIDRQFWHYEKDLERFRVSWSADSRWLTYAKDQDNKQTAIAIYDTQKQAVHQVTSGFYDDDQPAFDPDGKYLYYRTKRWFEAIYSEFEPTWIYANGQALIAVPLRNDVPSPLAPRNDEEPVAGSAKKPEDAGPKPDEKPREEPKPDEPKKEDEKKTEVAVKEQAAPLAKPAEPNVVGASARPIERKVKPVLIDLDSFEGRAVVLPPGGGRFDQLWAVSGKVLFTRKPRAGANTSTSPLSYYDLEKREEKLILDDAPALDLSADGKKLLIGRGKAWAIINVAENQTFGKLLNTGALEATIDPPAEWRQIFNDAWRIERDFFYDPHLHLVSWQKLREHYGRMLEDAATRQDVNYILGELLGELNVSHAYRSGGDVEAAYGRSVGYLGCDFALEEGAYRIKRILEAAPWEYVTRSPLRTAGVKQGEWLLAVNGRKLDPAKDPWAAFQGLADKPVFLSVNGKPTLEGAREVLVQPMGSEFFLRHYAWTEANRLRVEKASGGRIGYIYVPNTGGEGQSELFRQFRGQFTKPGLIIDERWNSGGQIPDRFIELLGRKITNYWGVRDGHEWQTPQIAHRGPKAILANGWSGSGGDCFPWLFRKTGLGPIVGTRTWGGLIGMTGAPALIDGGSVTVPTFSIYDTDGHWIIEGRGVEPDITVEDDPAQMQDGADPQLDRALQEILKSLDANPPAPPPKPAYPNRAGS
ncbi:MAG: tricorn protease [Chthoniobacter sp.]|jgi:tricorn protease|nr:tricorn protease [Chthoniobacter sp.]